MPMLNQKGGITIITDVSLLRLMQLSSASLPVGAYSFSQGMEYAVDDAWLTNSSEVENWLSVVMRESIALVDLPLLFRLIDAVELNKADKFEYWNAYVFACRETKELLLTEVATGTALMRLLKDVVEENSVLTELSKNKSLDKKVSFIAAFAIAVVHWKITKEAALMGYLWSWLENQIAAATKLVPLGQTAAQQLLIKLSEQVPIIIEKAMQCRDEEIGSSLPGLAMASAWHETQYSRLFRS